jgi:hypothetical protein
MWRPQLHGARIEAFGIAAASCVAIGGAALYYLRIEFGAGDGQLLSWSPIPAGILNLSTGHARGSSWAVPGAVVVSAAFMLLVERFRARARLSTTPAPDAAADSRPRS